MDSMVRVRLQAHDGRPSSWRVVFFTQGPSGDATWKGEQMVVLGAEGSEVTFEVRLRPLLPGVSFFGALVAQERSVLLADLKRIDIESLEDGSLLDAVYADPGEFPGSVGLFLELVGAVGSPELRMGLRAVAPAYVPVPVVASSTTN